MKQTSEKQVHQSFEEAGYRFGKSMTALNIDPLYYADRIMNYGGDWTATREESNAVLAGCTRAVGEMPIHTLYNNTVSDFMDKVEHDRDTMSTQSAEAFAHHTGIDSVLTLLVDRQVAENCVPDAFNRGKEEGQKILSLWQEATATL